MLGGPFYLERYRFHNGCSPLPEKLSAPAFSGSMPPPEKYETTHPPPPLNQQPLPSL